MAEQQASSGAERDARAERGTPRVAARRAHAHFKWRATLRSRIFVGAVMFGVWTAGIQARLVYLQVVERADMQARADRQHLRTLTAPAKRGEIVDRNGHVLAYSVDADSVFADPSEIESPDKVAQLVCAALDECGTARAAGDGAEPPPRLAVRLSRAQGVARRGAAGQGAGAERRRLHQGEPALLPEEGARGSRARLRRPRQHRAWPVSSRPTTRRFAAPRARSSSRPTPGGTRSTAGSIGRRPPARRSS